MIAAFKATKGPAQLQGGLTPGMVILQVNKQNVTSNQSPEEVMEMMHITNSPDTATATTTPTATETPAAENDVASQKVKLAVCIVVLK
jgi:hypothetical protein